MTKKTNKKQEQRQASIEKLLACALNLFVKVGYRATTVDQIVADAGVTKGTLYFYFKTKDEVMLRLLDEAEAFVVDPIESNLRTAGPEASGKLAGFINSQSKLGLTKPQHVLLLILMSIEFGGTGSEIEKRVKAIYSRMYVQLEDLIRQGQSEGTFRSDLDARTLASVVIAGHDGVLVEWYRRTNELTGRELARTLRGVLLSGLLVASPKTA
jgi:AcrR family transcriptional regulator